MMQVQSGVCVRPEQVLDLCVAPDVSSGDVALLSRIQGADDAAEVLGDELVSSVMVRQTLE